jgi:hypothetical protein
MNGVRPRLVIVLLALAIAAGALLRGALDQVGAPGGAHPELTSLREQLEEARRQLEQKDVENERLAAELSELKKWAEVLADAASASAPRPGEARPALGRDDRAARADVKMVEAAPAGGPVFNEQALLALGLHPDDVRELRELWRQLEAEKLELGVRAAGGGWADSYRHHQGLRRIDARARQELDDEAYDQYLFGTRRPNRLVVRDVLDGSVASSAGLRAGDAILRYEGERIFTTRELEAAISRGGRYEHIRLEVLRDGRELSFVVPRTPLGVLTALTVGQPYTQ